MQRISKVLQGLKYSFYLIFHPGKGFWDLKHEKKGNIGSSIVIVFLLIITFIIKRQCVGFLFNYNNYKDLNIIVMAASVIIPFVLWCVSNWCITTLVDGEGNFRDIVITSAYALMPLVIIQIPISIISNFFTFGESGFYTFFIFISVVWTAFLLVAGIMTVHQFTLGKTILTIIIAFIGMVIIMFLFILLFALIQQFINFFLLLEKEITMR